MSRSRKSTKAPRGRTGAVIAVLAIVVSTIAWLTLNRNQATPVVTAAAAMQASDKEVYAHYAGSQSCRECHTNAYTGWESSHHALAERAVDPKLDHAAFDPPRKISHGSQASEAKIDRGQLQFVSTGRDGREAVFPVERVIGETPLRQFLVPDQRGRFQVTELAFDPAKLEWFDIFGEEDRKPGEWGHWTGRGMTWNQMCASCHNTRLRKHYDPDTDSYHTTMAERSVGCESCHGGMSDHVKWQKARPQPAKGDPTIRKMDHARSMSTCGMCHARRGEVTGEFVPGDHFNDHFILTTVDETDIYHPDGQVRDENYEYGSFLSSKMFGAGVWCMDCHDPHSAKVKAASATDNLLCMKCHSTPLLPAPKIDEAKHSFHPAGKEGSRCVDCHMPLTTYMQRDPRRDHGFTIPDPVLTKQHGVPNACNRCHQDKDVEWSIQWVEKWYGKRMERPTRVRAQTIAEARRGNTNAVPGLTRLATTEKLGYWRASAVRLLGEYLSHPLTKAALIGRAGDHNALVRANAAHTLMSFAQEPDVAAVLQKLLSDESRAVRIEAAWSLRSELDTNSPAGRELLVSMRFNSDQPAGAMQWGTFLLDRGNPEAALPWFEKAVSWDGHSAPLRDALAVCYSMLGRTPDAVRELEAACMIAPRDAQLRYRLGLALNEAGRMNDALGALEHAVQLEPKFSAAWYNLGLGYSQLNRPEEALTALVQAETLDETSPRPPYARATVLAKLGRTEEARRAARRAIELQREFPEALQLLQILQ